MPCACAERRAAAQARLDQIQSELSALGVLPEGNIFRRAMAFFAVRRKNPTVDDVISQLEKEKAK